MSTWFETKILGNSLCTVFAVLASPRCSCFENGQKNEMYLLSYLRSVVLHVVFFFCLEGK